jgi:hypothetical protein
VAQGPRDPNPNRQRVVITSANTHRAISTETVRHLTTTDAGQQLELDAGGRMAEVAGSGPKGGDDLTFAARLASGHWKDTLILGLKCVV